MSIVCCNKLRGREGGGDIFSVKFLEWGWKGGLNWDFYLQLRTSECSFGFRTMHFLIRFPPVSSLKFSTSFFGVVNQEKVHITT